MKELETRVMDIDVDDIRNKMKSLAAIKEMCIRDR